jgi:surfactin synthase thioesterase subunit
MPDSEGFATTGESRSTAREAHRTDGARASRWLLRFKPLASPRVRLFCFPPAGGDANIFRHWQALLPDGVEVIGIQYPGRGRNQEALLRSCEEVVSALLALLPPSLGTDFAFFGHSNGALISFELARNLGLEHRQRMRHHFLSACSAPHLARDGRRTSELSDDEFLRKLRDMGGTPPRVMDDADLMRMLLPRLRADFHVSESYVFRPGAVLPCDLTLLRGSRDLAVDGARVARWAELTTGRWTEHVIEGDHFFITSHAAEVVGLIGATLSDHVLARGSERAVRT